MNSSKIYSLALSVFVKYPSSGEQIFKMFLNILKYKIIIKYKNILNICSPIYIFTEKMCTGNTHERQIFHY